MFSDVGTVNHDETGQSELCVLFPLSVLQGKKVQLVHGYKRAFLPHSFPLKTTITAGAKNCSVKLHATFCVTIFSWQKFSFQQRQFFIATMDRYESTRSQKYVSVELTQCRVSFSGHEFILCVHGGICAEELCSFIKGRFVIHDFHQN